jgi:hypothetical protein
VLHDAAADGARYGLGRHGHFEALAAGAAAFASHHAQQGGRLASAQGGGG